ncbi:type VI secretion system protein TssA [Vibrio albus]|uniref:Type VI secretion system protein TssA n=1 Tax=Vibrio albus TaxID=2200953 RepID=A0A2U3BBK0_9VIBR|nr:type VI secretion system protein TssA [Vibrio albus]PWI34104.1 type VI secretion system protein TssA [Vibrio albus]
MVAIDRTTLISDISADQICGEDLEYDNDFIELESLSQGKAEQQIGDTFVEAEDADWQEVKKKAIALLSRTKDIRVFIYLLRAVLRTDDLSTFNEVLAALTESLTTHWANIYPLLDEDDGDPTMRINALTTLCDEEVMLLPLRKTPVVKSRMLGNFSLRDITYATGEASPPPGYDVVSENTINGAFQDADNDELQRTSDAVTESLQNATQIEQFITEQVGVADAASFAPLSDELKEIQRILNQYVSTDSASAAVPATESASGSAAENNTRNTPVATPANPVNHGYNGQISSRDDVIRALEDIEHYYQQYEPTSPVPLLIFRAKRMVGMNFMEIIRDIAPDGISQVELIRGPEEEHTNNDQQDTSPQTNEDDW